MLSDFRARLVEHAQEEHIFELLVERLNGLGFLRAGGRQRTDSTQVPAAVRALNRAEFVGEVMRSALNALAACEPGWLAAWAPAAWQQRYGERVDAYRLPDGETARAGHLIQVGADGYRLLERIYDRGAPARLRQVPAVQVLREAWIQQYYRTGGEVRVRQSKDLPPGRLRLASPYDPEARYGVKRGTGWVGYKVHLTETCDDDTPHLITHVATTDATVEDSQLTAVVWDDLAARELLPAEHAVDMGYTSAALLVQAMTTYDVTLLGPMQASTSRQAGRDDGFDLRAFTIDFDQRQAICPTGHTSGKWREETSRGVPSIRLAFRKRDCGPCPLRPRCTTAAIGLRQLTIRPKAQHEALERARREQLTDDWKERYKIRAGIEGPSPKPSAPVSAGLDTSA